MVALPRDPAHPWTVGLASIGPSNRVKPHSLRRTSDRANIRREGVRVRRRADVEPPSQSQLGAPDRVGAGLRSYESRMRLDGPDLQSSRWFSRRARARGGELRSRRGQWGTSPTSSTGPDTEAVRAKVDEELRELVIGCRSMFPGEQSFLWRCPHYPEGAEITIRLMESDVIRPLSDETAVHSFINPGDEGNWTFFPVDTRFGSTSRRWRTEARRSRLRLGLRAGPGDC